MKRRILIVSTGLRIGGVERSLVSLLNSLDSERYKVALFLWACEGEFMTMIPSDVELLPEDHRYASIEQPIKNILLSKSFPIALARLFAKFTWAFRSRFFGVNGFLLPRSVRYCLPFLPSIEGEYDLAISFLSPHDLVLKKVIAKKTAGWIHTDYSTMECGVDHNFEMSVWQGLDDIAAVSGSVKETFSQMFPEIAEKVSVIENIVSPDFVLRQAEEDVTREMPVISNSISICSVGRFCHAKNFDIIPKIVVQLINIGIHIRWYLIGFGGDEPLIRAKITESNVEDQVIILGKKMNPYPYIKACDIYVQPSRYEGKAVTVREAQILGKPVLITNFPTAKSQLEDGVDGMICPLSIDGVADGVRKLIEDKGLREKLAKACSEKDYSNRDEVEKIYQLMEKKERECETPELR